MKIAIMSDLHLEFDRNELDRTGSGDDDARFDFYLRPPQPDADVLVLAGDISTGASGIDWASRNFRIPTVMIAGNHEFYRGDELHGLIAECRRKAKEMARRVIFLEQETWTYTTSVGEAVRFIGAALWTDFGLYDDPRISMNDAARRINDFRLISIRDQTGCRRLIPEDTVRLHDAARTFIESELATPFDGKTVVVSHHAPSPRSIDRKYKGSLLNPAFASDLDDTIERYQPDLWLHGHMHDSFDYRIGRTRVICNPRGYFPFELNPGFDPALVIEI
jgi:DNA repair exonuclease SbcCD nuclease subunit